MLSAVRGNRDETLVTWKSFEGEGRVRREVNDGGKKTDCDEG